MRLTGSDAKKVLQGQTTADFESAQPGQQLFAIFCNAKGRVLADVLAVVVQDDTVFLRGRHSVMARLAEHLKPYLAFSKSTLEHTDWLVGCERRDEDSTQTAGAEMVWDGESLSGVQLTRGDVFLEHWRSPALDARVTHLPAAPVSLAEVDLHTSRARIETETIGAYLPQDLDYDLNGSVSFTKGCYTGQGLLCQQAFPRGEKHAVRPYRAPETQRPLAQAIEDAAEPAARYPHSLSSTGPPSTPP